VTIPAPEVRARPVVIDVVRARPTKQNPQGKIKSIAYDVDVPQSASTMIKAFLDKPGWLLHVRYARGTWVDASGEPRHTFTWQYLDEWTAPSEKFPEGQRRKIKVWGDVEPARESILVRATLSDDDGPLEVLAGHWVDAEYVQGGHWRRSAGVSLLGWTDGLKPAIDRA
jgi:hypothetical protein